MSSVTVLLDDRALHDATPSSIASVVKLIVTVPAARQAALVWMSNLFLRVHKGNQCQPQRP
jgi:hypothetical protein